jgi:50S ribosomal protein L16 3-hydroxylase
MKDHAHIRLPWLGGLTAKTFLKQYWQKKPLLIRNAFAGFREPLSPDELAGLACEDGVEARLICRTGPGRWSVNYGPFEEGRFARLPTKRWTLLVQEVNRHVPEVATLLDRFSFIPNWRVDDVMISYATDGGGVGPHVDSYDVFLLQGSGQRRWRYDTRKTADVTFVERLPLRILKHFRPDAEEVLGPGDMLYLPPGFAHEGVAVGECTTYSIGFRAPNRAELTAAFVRSFATGDAMSDLYEDRGLQPGLEPGELTNEARARVREMVRRGDMSDTALDTAFARFASTLKPGHTFEPRARSLSLAQVKGRLSRGDALVRSEEGRFVFFPSSQLTINFFYGQHSEALSGSAANLARAVCRQRRLDLESLGKRDALTGEGLAAITRWINSGALSFAATRRPRVSPVREA